VDWVTVSGAALTLAGVMTTGWLTYRGTRTAAAIQAAPQAKAGDLAVLQATVNRVDAENGKLRDRQSRLESLLRAFSWTADRWARQMDQAGITPEPPHPLVDEYNRTGV
jgi:chromosome segregation ATPase